MAVMSRMISCSNPNPAPKSQHSKISGVLSSFLDAFKCHVSQLNLSKKKLEKQRSRRVNLKEMLQRLDEIPVPVTKIVEEEQRVEMDGIRVEQSPGEAGTKKKRLDSKWVVKQLQLGNEEQQERAASLIRKMSRDSPELRVEFAELGAIPLLVSLLQSSASSSKSQVSSLLALLNLAIGNNRNKESIVAAGAVPRIVQCLSEERSPEEIESSTAALLSISALDSNKPIIGSSGAIPLLVRVLQQGTSQAARDSVRVLYNLSLSPANSSTLFGFTDSLIQHLLVLSPESDEKLLAIIGTLVESSDSARKSVGSGTKKLLTALRSYASNLESPSPSSDSSSSSEDSSSSSSHSRGSGAYSGAECSREYSGEYASSGKSLNLNSSSRCQERVLYILMLVSHHSEASRKMMLESGAITPLLEVALLGSAIAQRRAARILDCLREDRLQRSGRPVSAPLSVSSRFQTKSRVNHEDESVKFCQERKAVDWMVKESLQRNMEKMVRRARLPSVDLDSNCGRLMMRKKFGSSSSCKSLIYG